MALSIKHPEADRLARQLVAVTGESLTEAVLKALRERLQREQGRTRTPCLRDELRAIRRRCASLPVLDRRSPEEIIGYEVAREAFRIYGKGRHAAGLNYGDCFAYALSKTSGEALLFKGPDFAQTDVTQWTFPQSRENI